MVRFPLFTIACRCRRTAAKRKTARQFSSVSQGERGRYDAIGGKRFGILALAIERLRRRSDQQTPGGLGNIARAFAHRNYRIYVIGNSISLIG